MGEGCKLHLKRLCSLEVHGTLFFEQGHMISWLSNCLNFLHLEVKSQLMSQQQRFKNTNALDLFYNLSKFVQHGLKNDIADLWTEERELKRSKKKE